MWLRVDAAAHGMPPGFVPSLTDFTSLNNPILPTMAIIHCSSYDLLPAVSDALAQAPHVSAVRSLRKAPQRALDSTTPSHRLSSLSACRRQAIDLRSAPAGPEPNSPALGRASRDLRVLHACIRDEADHARGAAKGCIGDGVMLFWQQHIIDTVTGLSQQKIPVADRGRAWETNISQCLMRACHFSPAVLTICSFGSAAVPQAFRAAREMTGTHSYDMMSMRMLLANRSLTTLPR
ncbi:uncharacterized protein MYCFIDRAFT_178453 [Pseudocercospora fijiensis CIRAD86]|uniref:Uncharacterized protein n=1 Tax=Pseudocercospora fijiensis (strain CIRAD86) TaxID=383855 RepID=M2YKP8_PSEFD|nr:uncharacterized protein MYCFIDRAFT_178453 [Pseudocercospora fijiensis CIRAD86]EME78295.1 hypothetical protein MYCFIDRAFT_178453 [Pseudocercospora fijiensis CIRAD86]